ncbi:hypothetical protein AMATHDRAFT_6172 [Amanita thiersii Skay4041]|uniref:DUF6533 domain-containing protein n=1 Tax=Amanita thiersii Skay4041 TaxID=703135 RepID=A0A2A9NIG2_9AGAR|nr:hypothetical protein AMATHDRAFT_6172 [Amanita thiersii Skay4041]
MATRDLQTVVFHESVLGYVDTAAMALLYFDYLLTLHMEVAYVWKSKWTLIKILFLILRYMPMATLSMVLLVDGHNSDAETCAIVTRVYAVFVTLETGMGEIILTMRTWAIWGRDHRIGLGLSIFFICKTMIGLIILSTWLKTLHYGVFFTTFGSSCALISSSKILYVDWLLLVIFESVVCMLLAIQAFSAFRAGGVSHLARVVYRDGLMYYLYLMMTFLLTLISIIVFPFDLVRLLSGPAHVIHVVLTARVILHAREQADKQFIYETPTFFAQTY